MINLFFCESKVGDYPILTKKNNGKIVIINLQPTRIDKHSDLIINGKIDEVFEILFDLMNLKLGVSKPNIEINLKLDKDDDNDSMFIDIRDIIVDPGYKNINKIANEATFLIESKKSIIKNSVEPNLILIVSGKRKTGKDYICQKIIDILKSINCFISINVITLSSPLKKMYAIEHNLDYLKLLDSSDYKETYRKDMIRLMNFKILFKNIYNILSF